MSKDQEPISNANRIRELTAIEEDIVACLQNAGSAFQSLAGHTMASADAQKDSQATPGERASIDPAKSREIYARETSAYLTRIQSIGARLRRQIYALEEAGIIPPTRMEPKRDPSNPAMKKSQDQEMEITNGGMGNFDVGWLNSRRGDGRKEGELWKEARQRLEEVGAGAEKQVNGAEDGMELEQDGEIP